MTRFVTEKCQLFYVFNNEMKLQLSIKYISIFRQQRYGLSTAGHLKIEINTRRNYKIKYRTASEIMIKEKKNKM